MTLKIKAILLIMKVRSLLLLLQKCCYYTQPSEIHNIDIVVLVPVPVSVPVGVVVVAVVVVVVVVVVVAVVALTLCRKELVSLFLCP